MKIVKKVTLILIILLFSILISNKVLATNENITYKAEYKDAISYEITIDGLEEYDEEYIYNAIISQSKEITTKEFQSLAGPSFNISYNKTTKKWIGQTNNGEFEKQGQYYIYVAKLKMGSTKYEMIDGPTEIKTPALPPLGERINIYSNTSNTSYFIKVNAINTMSYSNVQRTIKFYLGEIKDEALLEKLDTNGKSAYNELLDYAKKQKANLKEDSFKDTKTGVLDYNIVKDYQIENGKYYFIYSILDDEGGEYVEVEDVAPYNGKVSSQGGYLEQFKYTKPEKEETVEDKETTEPENKESQNQTVNEEKQQVDNTQANNPIPQTGSKNIEFIIILVAVMSAVTYYYKYKRYKDI